MLDGIPFADFTPPALLGITFLLVILGRLVPWYIYKEKSAECDKWRKAWETEKEIRVAENAQTKELLELAKTTHSVIVAVFGAIERSRRSGEAYVVPKTTPD